MGGGVAIDYIRHFFKRQCENENIKANSNIIHCVRCVRSHARTPCAHKPLPCCVFRQLNRCPDGDQSTTTPPAPRPPLSTPKHVSQGLDGLDRRC